MIFILCFQFQDLIYHGAAATFLFITAGLVLAILEGTSKEEYEPLLISGVWETKN